MYATYQAVEIPEIGRTFGTGWLPAKPDLRDYTTADVGPMMQKLGSAALAKGGMKAGALPSKVDLRQWCSDIDDQMHLGSCTAHAAVGVVEYCERRAFGRNRQGSRLFVYKATRNLMQVTGDTGADLRNTMGALVLCGVPDEKYWPYTDADPAFDKDPTSFVYALGGNYQALKYFCHDPWGANVPGNNVLASVKFTLAYGVPSMFGFWGFPSFNNTNVPGGIPYPCPGEKAVWGHAIAAVGYDDDKKIKNTQCNKETKGALLIRNSWGKSWGENGYGWIPYDYVLNYLADDFWSIMSMEWVDTKQFGLS
jgi:C1A family cysteine protease